MPLPFPPNEWQWRDRDGDVLPWFTRPFLDLLEKAALWYVSNKPDCGFGIKGASVLEWGAGYSTLWWLKHCRYMESIENKAEWAESVVAAAAERFGRDALVFPGMDGINNHLKGRMYALDAYDPDPTIANLYIAGAARDQKWDIIVIDAERRGECAVEALKHIKPGGLIILDNSEHHPEIFELLKFNEHHTFPQPGHPHWCTTYWKITQLEPPPASAEIATAEHKKRRGTWG
jgi:hypothetical protein